MPPRAPANSFRLLAALGDRRPRATSSTVESEADVGLNLPLLGPQIDDGDFLRSRAIHWF